jgi:serine/threonine protein kinase
MKEIDVGQVIGGKYSLERLVGVGAMGQVWVAQHQALKQTFAVKVMLPPEASLNETAETAFKRFENEARIAASLSRKSRHIAAVTDYGIDDGVAYLVMELLVGDGLEKRIGDGLCLRPAEVSTIVTQMAKGLVAAHTDGVMHRDLKPANVFLTHDEEQNVLVKLLDFGIARMGADPKRRTPTRLTMKGLVLGSPGYMSPEQAMAESPDTRSDVWSLAVVAFEALAGVTPFNAKDPDETILRICNFQATPLKDVMQTSDELDAVFKRAFTPKLDERFQTAPAFAEALAAALPAPVARIEANATTVKRRPDAGAETGGGVSLKVPLRPRKLLSAIVVGGAVGLLLAAGIVGARRLTGPSSVTVGAVAEVPTVTTSAIPSTGPLHAVPPSPASVTTLAPAVSTAPPQPRATERVRPMSPAMKTSSQPRGEVPPTPAPSKSVDRSAIF